MYQLRGRARSILVICALLSVSVAHAADAEVSEEPAPQEAVQEPTPPAPDKRVFGVLPNYRIADNSQPFVRLTAKRKFYIGFKDSTDYPIFFTTAVLVGISQAQAHSDAFGGGVKGFAKTYAANYSGQAAGSFSTEALFPVLLREDPRYFRLGTGSTRSRLRYALTRVFVTRTDAGGKRFNCSELLGNVVTATVSNAYSERTRTGRLFGQSMGIQYATDALGMALKEFWPDIKRRWLQR